MFAQAFAKLRLWCHLFKYFFDGHQMLIWREDFGTCAIGCTCGRLFWNKNEQIVPIWGIAVKDLQEVLNE
jgi:hypothetical protein